jgi:hypothetical protein
VEESLIAILLRLAQLFYTHIIPQSMCKLPLQERFYGKEASTFLQKSISMLCPSIYLTLERYKTL